MMQRSIDPIRGNPSPLELFRYISKRPYPFFLDSSSGTKELARFSFLGSDPFLVFRSKGRDIELEWSDGRIKRLKSDPFAALKEIFERYKAPYRKSAIPLTSGGVGYFSYDMKDLTEELPDKAIDDLALPDCVFAFYKSILIYDHSDNRAYVSNDPSFDADFKKDDGKSDAIALPCGEPSLRSNFSKTSYMKAVEMAKQYIGKGDIYQVNLSQRFSADLAIEPAELYLKLRRASPAPFSAFLGLKDLSIMSSSPERFLMKRGGYIETRPIKGTRPRGRTMDEDALLASELVNSQKDRAEHIMIVDLERNDLGKICEYGSVKLSNAFALEKYANVFHLVSTVSGRLKAGVGPIDCISLTFPGGSITGAPKIRSMEIIEELENVKRSAYTGALGYISFDGNMDTSIVIRTFIAKNDKVYFQVGGGIVADSDPRKEYEETLHKARGLFQALGANRKREVSWV